MPFELPVIQSGRVLNLIQCSNLGGMEHSTVAALCELTRRGHQCSLLSLNRVGTLATVAAREGIPLDGVDYRGYAGWRSVWQLKGKIAASAPQAIIMSGPSVAGMAALQSICPGRRLLKVHFHHQGVKPNWQWRVLYEVALRTFTHISFCSDFIRLEAEEICPSLRGVARTLRNPFRHRAPVSVDEKSRARNDLGLPEDANIIGNAGWLIDRKRFDVFLRAAAQAARALPRSVFVIAGDGPSRPSLVSLAGELGIADRVRWLGWRDNLERFYQSLDVLLFNSDWDALPRVVPEAMSFGIPVVASLSHGGLRELIDCDASGFLLACHDEKTLSARVIELMKSPDEARRIGLGGQRRLLTWSPPGQHGAAMCDMLGLA